MSWIEGVGDEVTITFTIVLGLSIILLAWYSTGIREIPFISVIIVQLTRRRLRAQNGDQPQSQNEAGESTPEESQREATVAEPGPGETSESGSSLSPPNTRTENRESENKTFVESVADTGNAYEEGRNQHIEELAAVEEKASEEAESTQTKLENSVDITTEPSESNTDETALSEQELRQRRLEFFIRGSQDKIENETVSVSPLENGSGNGSSDRTPVSSNVDQSSNLVQNSQSTESNSNTGPGQDRIANRTQGHVENQPSTEGSDEIRVRIKFFNDEQRLVTCSPMDTIGHFRRSHFSTELSESKLVRFIFNGQDLRNDALTLQSYNIMDNSVLHCLITQPQPASQQASDDDDGLDMGMVMFPLFGLLLGIVWYMRFMYRQFFNVTSTLTLGGITFLYLAAFLSTFRTRRHEHLD